MSENSDSNAPGSGASYNNTGEYAGSPTDGVFESAASGTATFPNTTSSIQLPPRLQRSFIPPPIDTENASKIHESSFQGNSLSTLSPSSLGAGQPAANPSSLAEVSAGGVEPLVSDNITDAGEHTETGSTQCAHIGVSFSKNRRYRRTMEDAHYHKYDFDGIKGQSFLAIFDGHAGRQAAQWCGDNFADLFRKLATNHSSESVPEVLNRAFIEADRRLASEVKTSSGCTAVVAFVKVEKDAKDDPSKHSRTLYCANVGDARAVLSRGGKAKRLTYDHKGDDSHEIERISEAGGYVFNGRVNGILAVTRALGDSSLKQFVIGNPYTTETKLDDEDDILILACDGLWDVCSDQEAVDMVRDESDPARASQILLDHALSNDSMDNITAMVFRMPRDNL